MQALERHRAETAKHEREMQREQGLLTNGEEEGGPEGGAANGAAVATRAGRAQAPPPGPSAPIFAPQVRLAGRALHFCMVWCCFMTRRSVAGTQAARGDCGVGARLQHLSRRTCCCELVAHHLAAGVVHWV